MTVLVFVEVNNFGKTNCFSIWPFFFGGGETGEESLVSVLFTCNKQMRELVGFFKNLISCVLVYNGKAISWILIMSAGQT